MRTLEHRQRLPWARIYNVIDCPYRPTCFIRWFTGSLRGRSSWISSSTSRHVGSYLSCRYCCNPIYSGLFNEGYSYHLAVVPSRRVLTYEYVFCVTFTRPLSICGSQQLLIAELAICDRGQTPIGKSWRLTSDNVR